MEKISWTDRVRNVEVLHRGKVVSNILYANERRLTRLVTSCVGTGLQNTLFVLYLNTGSSKKMDGI